MLKSLDEIIGGVNWFGMGIAGNQAGHLQQAGEATDFAEVITDENAPKGVFPWYVPSAETFLKVNPLSSKELKLCGEDPLQPEPEVALVVELQYGNSELLSGLNVLGFTVFNDCSRRIKAEKISHKKNWGECSQGVGNQVVLIDDFQKAGGSIESYRLACYLERDGELIQYGEDTPVSEYCYFNSKLVEWVINQIHTQIDHGPLENVRKFFEESRPSHALISIGATRYTDFANSDQRFLREGDRVFVAAYDSNKYSQEQVEGGILKKEVMACDESLLILSQKVSR